MMRARAGLTILTDANWACALAGASQSLLVVCLCFKNKFVLKEAAFICTITVLKTVYLFNNIVYMNMFFFSLQIMCALGNARVNGIYEYEIPNHVKKPNPQSSRYNFYNRERNES